MASGQLCDANGWSHATSNVLFFLFFATESVAVYPDEIRPNDWAERNYAQPVTGKGLATWHNMSAANYCSGSSTYRR